MSDTTLRLVNRICQEGIARNRAKVEESGRKGDKHSAAFYLSVQERYERVLAEVHERVAPPGTLDTLINLNIEESQFDPQRTAAAGATSSAQEASLRLG
jgi:hypothetical protein